MTHQIRQHVQTLPRGGKPRPFFLIVITGALVDDVVQCGPGLGRNEISRRQTLVCKRGGEMSPELPLRRQFADRHD